MKYIYFVPLILSIMGLIGFYMITGEVENPFKQLINVSVSGTLGFSLASLLLDKD